MKMHHANFPLKLKLVVPLVVDAIEAYIVSLRQPHHPIHVARREFGFIRIFALTLYVIYPRK